MKTYIYFLTVALFFVIGCKEELTSSTSAGPNTAPPPATDPTLSVSFNHDPATAGEAVTITAAVAESISGSTAKVQLEQAYDSDPEQNANAQPVSCDYSGTITWVMVAQSSSGVGSVSYSWTPSANGDYGFRVHFVKGNSNYNNLIGDCTNLEVSNGTSCNPTVTVSVENLGNIWDGGYPVYKVTWTVCSCTEGMSNVVLGGTLIDVITDQSVQLIDDPMVSFEVMPDVYDGPTGYQTWFGTGPVTVAWNIPNLAADECASRSVLFELDPSLHGDRITDGWHLDFDTESQSGRSIEVDPVMVEH